MTDASQIPDAKIPDALRLPNAFGLEEHKYTIEYAANGVPIMLPVLYVDFINANPFLEQQVDKLAEMVADIEKRTGKHFDRPLHLTEDPHYLSFSTGLIPEEARDEMFGKEAADKLRKLVPPLKEGDNAAILRVPLVALMENSPLTMKDIEGIVLHELGHAASRDLIQQQGESMLWLESLQKIDQMSRLVAQFPELTAPITQEIGGNDAYLKEVEKLFTQVGTEVQSVLLAGAAEREGRKFVSPESLLDHHYHDEKFMRQYEKLSTLGTGDTLAEFDRLHDVTVNLLMEAVKQGAQFTPGHLNHLHAGAIQSLANFGQLQNHAREFFADDFATRHHPAPTKYLGKLPEHGDGDSHPSTIKRVLRADYLDDERIGQLVEKDSIDEHAATKATNSFMRGKGAEKAAEYLQEKQSEALRQRLAKQQELFRERIAQQQAAKEAKRGEAFRR